MKKEKTIALLGCCGILGAFLYFHANRAPEPQAVQAETVKEESGTEGAQQVFEAPKTYKKEIPGSSLSFDAEVIVPENFDARNFYAGTGMKNLDVEKAFEICFEDAGDVNWETEEYPNAWGEKETWRIAEDDKGNYILAQGTGSIIYSKEPESSYVNNCVRLGKLDPAANQDMLDGEKELDFMGRKQAAEEVESKLGRMGLTTEGSLYHIFGLDIDTLKEQEEAFDMDGNVAREELNPEWTKDQETYYFFGEQTFQGLPVYAGEGISDTGFYEDMESFPIQVMYSQKGIIFCRLENCYQFTKGGDKMILAPFEEIVKAVEEKFEGLTDINELIVRKMKLVEFPKRQKDGVYQLMPVWICYMDVLGEDGEPQEWYQMMSVNAITGEEEISIEGQ